MFMKKIFEWKHVGSLENYEFIQSLCLIEGLQ